MPGTTVTGADFMCDLTPAANRDSGSGRCSAATAASTSPSSTSSTPTPCGSPRLNEPVARVFSHHWPDAPNLGDITTIDWSQVEPVDILIGGFPCQDVSTVGKRAGLAPGTRSGLWAHMAAAIDALQPEWVVIENVRGLLSSPATRPAAEGDDHERRNPGDATPAAQPFAAWNATRGIWETTQLDLYGLSAPFSAIWPTCGWMRDGSAYRLRLSALLTNASASSPSPGALFRTPLATDSSRGGETLDQVRARRGTIALSHQIIDFALHGPAGSPSRRAESETLWSLIDRLFSVGDATLTPSPAGNTSLDDPRPRQPY
jgi:hypothetical protein